MVRESIAQARARTFREGTYACRHSPCRATVCLCAWPLPPAQERRKELDVELDKRMGVPPPPAAKARVEYADADALLDAV